MTQVIAADQDGLPLAQWRTLAAALDLPAGGWCR